jgi:hypothetical protein
MVLIANNFQREFLGHFGDSNVGKDHAWQVEYLG